MFFSTPFRVSQLDKRQPDKVRCIYFIMSVTSSPISTLCDTVATNGSRLGRAKQSRFQFLSRTALISTLPMEFNSPACFNVFPRLFVLLPPINTNNGLAPNPIPSSIVLRNLFVNVWSLSSPIPLNFCFYYLFFTLYSAISVLRASSSFNVVVKRKTTVFVLEPPWQLSH